MQLDEHLKHLLRVLARAINDTVSESDRIGEAIANVRGAGYDIDLKLNATIRVALHGAHPGRITPNASDRRFLDTMHIQVEVEEHTQETL